MNSIFGNIGWGWKSDPQGWRPPHIDPTNHELVVTGVEHHEIHEGHMWHWSLYDTDVDIADPVDIIITTPAASTPSGGFDTYWDPSWHTGVHWAGAVTASAAVVIELLEGVTTIVGGTAQTVYNRNRLATHTLNTTIILDPASYVTAAATTLETGYVGVSSLFPSQRVGGDARTNIEWLLKASTSYALRVTAVQDNTVVSVSMDFYEHPHKDNWKEWEL